MDHLDYLLRLAELELINLRQRMVERRIRAARFPAVKSLDTFDLPAIPSVNKQLVMQLARCEYIERKENVIAVGNSGAGKTHVALGLGLAACQRGMSVGFTTAAGLVHEMMEARDERRLLNLQRQLSRLKLLIVDELGFVPLSRTGVKLLFEVFSQRYERGSIMVTTQPAFRRMDRGFRLGASHRRVAGPPHPPCAHPGNERGKLPSQAQPGERYSSTPGGLGQPISRASTVLTHPPSLLPACLCDTSPEQLARTFPLAKDLWWYTFAPPHLLTFREKVLTNWPAEMSHSTYGECDIDAQRTDETQDPQQPAG